MKLNPKQPKKSTGSYYSDRLSSRRIQDHAKEELLHGKFKLVLQAPPLRASGKCNLKQEKNRLTHKCTQSYYGDRLSSWRIQDHAKEDQKHRDT